ncbi:MAG: tetratricopeptide repeat protein, partial [Xanthomonadales bacterium]|nr:tetratricopeptide repeat protein [Xanthomonadales bacterium]
VARAGAMGGMNDLVAARRTFADARALAAQLASGKAQAVRRVDVAEADALAIEQRFPEALELADAARTRWSADGAPPDRRMLDLLATIATAASSTGDLERADAAHREAIALAERIHARPHPDTAWVIGSYGSFLVSKARYAEAEPYIERALAMRRNLLGDTHPDTLNALAALGRLRSGQLRRDEARRAFEEGVEHCRAGQVRHPVCPRLLGSLSQMLLADGADAEAERLAARAVEEQRALSGDESPPLVTPLQFLARIQVRRLRYDEALQTTDTLLAIATRAGTLASKDVRYARFQRALALFALGRNDEALELARAVVSEQKAKTPDEKSTLFSMLMLEARALARAGQRDNAKQSAAEALAIEPKPRGTDAAMLANLARIAREGRGD